MTPTTQTTTIPAIDIQLDCLDIGQTIAFWKEGLGFQETGNVLRAGTVLETRSLARPDNPEILITFSSCKPRPVSACSKGTIRSIALRVADLPSVRQKLEALGAEVVTAPDSPESEHLCRVLDPNGYLVELRGDPRAGS